MCPCCSQVVYKSAEREREWARQTDRQFFLKGDRWKMP